ncbi:class I SAM-dependent methyltransferase [Actinomadura sp. HBU206391]|nr:class I SAM-dependent methyltransferase [Actinomadura sp. HBU206391]
MPETRPSEDDGLSLNRAVWNTRARIHGSTPTDRFYDVESFLSGRQTLHALERELAGDVAGKDLLHLQCHFGMDTLSWARLGARVTGVDFSPAAIERARLLAGRAGLAATFVEADTQRLPVNLAGGFDLVVATYGVLCWMPTSSTRTRSVRSSPRSWTRASRFGALASTSPPNSTPATSFPKIKTACTDSPSATPTFPSCTRSGRCNPTRTSPRSGIAATDHSSTGPPGDRTTR